MGGSQKPSRVSHTFKFFYGVFKGRPHPRDGLFRYFCFINQYNESEFGEICQ